MKCSLRPAERDLLLLLLAVAAGSADGWSYLGLGHAFVANMTGNTVLMGIAVFERHGDLLHPAISLICYAAGVVFAAFLTRHVRPGSLWPRKVSLTLLLESVLMIFCEAGWIAVRLHSVPAHAVRHTLDALLGLAAFAIGMQSGAMLQLQIPGIVTTYITGTWTTLMSGLVRFTIGKEQRAPRQNRQFEERLLMQAGILAAYFLAALFTGWLFRYQPLSMGALTAASALLVAVYSAVRA